MPTFNRARRCRPLRAYLLFRKYWRRLVARVGLAVTHGMVFWLGVIYGVFVCSDSIQDLYRRGSLVVTTVVSTVLTMMGPVRWYMDKTDKNIKLLNDLTGALEKSLEYERERADRLERQVHDLSQQVSQMQNSQVRA